MTNEIPNELNFCYFTLDKGYTCINLEKNNTIVFNGFEKKYYSPNIKEWSKFRNKLDEIGIWDWTEDYDRCCLVDGYSWELRIKYDDCSVEAEGINHGPRRIVNNNVFECLIELIEAIEELTGFKF